jgi:hypothetical protein
MAGQALILCGSTSTAAIFASAGLDAILDADASASGAVRCSSFYIHTYLFVYNLSICNNVRSKNWRTYQACI